MTDSNIKPLFHTGKRLQKLRELQGLSTAELAEELQISSDILREWEHTGVPEQSIQLCYYYFEVSANVFNDSVNSQFELEQLAKDYLYPETNNKLQERLALNKQNKATHLDLSNLNLREVPDEVFEYTWLTELNISHNQIKHISSQIILLQQLEHLDISHNFLTHIPGIIASLDNLKKLRYLNNPLSSQLSLVQDGTLEAYKNFLLQANIFIIVIDKQTQNSFYTIDRFRETIEPSDVVIISSTSACLTEIKPYTHLFSLTYITENSCPDYLIAQIDTFLPKQLFHLLIVFNQPLTSEQQTVIENRLAEHLPPSKFVVKCLNDKQNSTFDREWFFAVYNHIHQQIIFQNQLPFVKFERLILNNIGVYKQLDIAFNSDLTVLIGLNGAGKTTILKAIALATLGAENAGIDAQTAANLLRITGKQAEKTHWQTEGTICLSASINGQMYENTIRLIYNTNTESVDIEGARFSALFNDDGHLLNLILGISEQRNTNLKKSYTSGHKETKAKVKDLLAIISGEEQACITQFSTWLGNLYLWSKQGHIDEFDKIDTSFLIFSELMQEPIQFSGLTSVDPLELWVEHQDPKQVVPLRLVSQGYQAVMGWVGHIIQRMFEAYSEALQPLQQPAIIIIDEIDQLLHIKWQQTIINVLAKEFFPNTQWIITTHSPMVVTGLDKGQVIQLHQRDGQLVAEPNTVDLWLWQYGDIVQHLFEVSPQKPQLQEQQLVAEIELLTSQTEELDDTQQKELEKLEIQLEKVQKSRAFVDELYAEQQKLRIREKELAILIEQLSQT